MRDPPRRGVGAAGAQRAERLERRLACRRHLQRDRSVCPVVRGGYGRDVAPPDETRFEVQAVAAVPRAAQDAELETLRWWLALRTGAEAKLLRLLAGRRSRHAIAQQRASRVAGCGGSLNLRTPDARHGTTSTPCPPELDRHHQRNTVACRQPSDPLP